MVDDAVDQNAHADKGEQKGDRGDKHAPPGAVGDGGADQEAQAG